MKVPPKRKGNGTKPEKVEGDETPSMKVPPKRKGNLIDTLFQRYLIDALNESPSEKEGKLPESVKSAL